MKRVAYLWIAITIAVAGCKTIPISTPNPDPKNNIRQDSILLPGWDGLDLETMTLGGPTPLPEFLTKVTGLTAPQIATLRYSGVKENHDIMYGTMDAKTREFMFRNGARGALLPGQLTHDAVTLKDVENVPLSEKPIPIKYDQEPPNIIVETKEGNKYIVPVLNPLHLI